MRTSRISWAKTAPMCANWSRCSGRASAFAPESISTDGLNRAGTTTAIAGRNTPGMRRMFSSPAASIAPVFPADTTASASPSPTARHAATRLESGFDRTASAGFSCISITSAASTRSRPWVSRPAGPKTTTSRPSRDASTAPAITSAGPRSPPRASTAITPLRGGSRQRLDVTSPVRLAVRADVMRPLRAVADRALVHARRLEAMRRPALVAA